MPRLIRLSADRSVKIDPASIPPGKMISLCACGLSKTFPLCDGAHKTISTTETDPTKLYVYGSDRATIIEIRDDLPPAEPAPADAPATPDSSM